VHPHPHRQPELQLRLAGGFQRARSGRESDEERIALRVHLRAAVPLKRIPQDAPMLG
jgi:hypothetical protein